MMKDTEEIVEYLRTNKKGLRDNFGVTRLGLFGSFVRHTQRISSDIDMVVEFEKSRKNIQGSNDVTELYCQILQNRFCYMGQLVEWPEVVTEGKDIEECRMMLKRCL